MAITVCAMRQDKRAQRRQPRAHGSDPAPSRRATRHRQKQAIHDHEERECVARYARSWFEKLRTGNLHRCNLSISLNAIAHSAPLPRGLGFEQFLNRVQDPVRPYDASVPPKQRRRSARSASRRACYRGRTALRRTSKHWHACRGEIPSSPRWERLVYGHRGLLPRE